MSALTKTFVLLHVVMSMILAAGLIVFVNRVDDFQQTKKSTDASLSLAKQQAAEATAELQTQKAANQAAVQAAQGRVDAMQKELVARDQQMADVRTQLAEAQAQAATAQAALTSATEGLKVAQQNQGTLQVDLGKLRQTHDKLMQQFTDANLSINDISARLSQTDRQRKDLQEQVAQLTSQLNNAGASGARTEAGGANGAQLATGRLGVGSTVNVNGVVREKRTIAGVPYATISIGSADAVQKGMRLKVLGGRNGQDFLGYVTITQVDPEEAIGRLDGPRIKEVTVNSPVVSQL